MDGLKVLGPSSSLAIDDNVERLIAHLRLAIEDGSPKLPGGMATNTATNLLSALAGLTGDVLSVLPAEAHDVVMFAFEDLVRKRAAERRARGIRSGAAR